MGIDTTTEPNFVNIVIDDSPKYLETLRQQAIEDGEDDFDDGKKLSITNDKHGFTDGEYYYDDKENKITITGSYQAPEGKTLIYLVIPLSDAVLIDIIQGGLKKLNKLKTALETLS